MARENGWWEAMVEPSEGVFGRERTEMILPYGDWGRYGRLMVCVHCPPASQRGARRQPGVERSGTLGHMP